MLKDIHESTLLSLLNTSIHKVFADLGIVDLYFAPGEAWDTIRRSTWTGEGDPGGWAREAAFVIHTENGLPNPACDVFGSEAQQTFWNDVIKDLAPRLGIEPWQLFAEPVNLAVLAIYLQK